jgi:hypothetical protein
MKSLRTVAFSAAWLGAASIACGQLIHVSAGGVIVSKYWGYNWGAGSEPGESFHVDVFFGRPGITNHWALRAGELKLSGKFTELTTWDNRHLNLLFRNDTTEFSFVFAASFAESWSGRIPRLPLPPLADSPSVFLDYFSKRLLADVEPGKLIVDGFAQGQFTGNVMEVSAVNVPDVSPVPESASFAWVGAGTLIVVSVFRRRWRRGAPAPVSPTGPGTSRRV